MAAITRNKKAFEMEFHWVFVLIAGALILIFFFTMAQKQKTISQDRLTLTLSTQLENVFISAMQNEGTAQTIPLPTKGIIFYAPSQQPCGQTLCDCNYYIFDRPTKFADKIMFVPNELNAPEAIVWTFAWKTPFRATNFFYMTTKKTKYLFVVNTEDSASKQLKNKILRDLPEEIEKEIIEDTSKLSKTETYNFENTRIIFINKEPSVSEVNTASKGRQASIVHIDLQNNEAIFYNKKTTGSFEQTTQKFMLDTTGSEAINEAMLYGVIFAEHPHLYECQIKEAYKKLSNVARIIKMRAGEIETAIQPTKPQCVYPTTVIGTMETNAKNAAQNPLTATLLGEAKALKKIAEEQLDCPHIY